MRLKLILSSLIFSLYFQGLDLFFCIVSFINFKPTWLTGLYQIGLLITFFFITLSEKNSRRLLFKVGFPDVLHLCFFGLVLLDINLSNLNYSIPEDITIYFTVYSFSLFLGRALNFQQLKWVCYFTNFIGVFTCFLLLLQIITGSASYANHGTRLVTGLAGNPINTGYIGSYTFLSSLILSLKFKDPLLKIAFAIFSIPGIIISFLSGTRSANIFTFLGLTLIVFMFFWVNFITFIDFKKKNFFSKSLTLKFCLGFALFILVSVLIDPELLQNFYEPEALSLFSFEKAWSRISQLFLVSSNQVTDKSILSRFKFYENAINIFLENPVLGGEFYSAGYVHNAFLQSASDFGILGIVTFILPFLYSSYQCLEILISNLTYKKNYFGNDYWMISVFSVIFFLEATCLFSFHGDPYRSYIPLCIFGVLISSYRAGKFFEY